MSTIEKELVRPITVRTAHSWQTAYLLALKESDPGELLGRIRYAISAIERRYSEWEAAPGSTAELEAIQKCISDLKRLMKREQTRRHGAVTGRFPIKDHPSTNHFQSIP